MQKNAPLCSAQRHPQDIILTSTQLRGENYEPRLIKYAERGFAVGVPEMRQLVINREKIALKIIPDPYQKVMSSFRGTTCTCNYMLCTP
jgi:hypothetical protein